jgi:hypothetical protein
MHGGVLKVGEHLAHLVSDRCTARLAGGKHMTATLPQVFGEHSRLGGFATPIGAL